MTDYDHVTREGIRYRVEPKVAEAEPGLLSDEPVGAPDESRRHEDGPVGSSRRSEGVGNGEMP